ncbi:MAG: hypothetical protein FJ388_26865, partial [Verrucomicrobia bacterium]|nr:hypothetical protein [Verrucomicrobiota bacterium]
MRQGLAAIVLGIAAATAVAQGALDFTAFGQLAIQEGGRKKPLDTFARETVQRITGKADFNGQDPIATVLSVAFAGDDKAWAGAKMVRIVFKPLKQRLGLPEQDNYFSYQELAANPKLN